jgi:hypothetical protein
MSLTSAQTRLARIKRQREEAQAELAAEKEIAAEMQAAIEARVELARLTETATEKEERLEFQARLARITGCAEMDPDWRNQPNYPSGKPHKGVSAS